MRRVLLAAFLPPALAALNMSTSAAAAISAAGAGAAPPAASALLSRLAPALSPVVLTHAASGASLTLTLFGAQVLSFTHAGQEALFLSSRAVLDGSAPIRGGIPIAFPQFAAQGPLPMHGFARTAAWELVERGDGRAVLALRDSEATRALWPHAFALRYEVTFAGPALTAALTVTNTGAAPLAFEALLHTYLAGGGAGAVGEGGAGALRLRGLAGQAYFAKATQEEGVEGRGEFALEGEFDRVYRAREGGGGGGGDEVVVGGLAGPAYGTARVRRAGAGSASGAAAVDVVVWNPGPVRAAAIADLGPEDWRSYVCVEPGRVSPATAPAGLLQAGQSFTLTQELCLEV